VQLATELTCVKQQAELHMENLHRAKNEMASLKASDTASEVTILKLQTELQNLRADVREIELQRDSALTSLRTQAEQMQVALRLTRCWSHPFHLY
jgi:chromosome segregation ATPase